MDIPGCFSVLFCTTTICAAPGLLYIDENHVQLLRNHETAVWSAPTSSLTFALHATTKLHSIIQHNTFLVAVFYFLDQKSGSNFTRTPPHLISTSTVHVPLGPLHVNLQDAIRVKYAGRVIAGSLRRTPSPKAGARTPNKRIDRCALTKQQPQIKGKSKVGDCDDVDAAILENIRLMAELEELNKTLDEQLR